ncbi:hypothetical protein [Mycoplasma todarodis]|uniref:Uncharacterized protein n=1 Tax=Mycoplasma todarodis TaxID=1937191 RepID=A0A4R0XVY3_9MOLU|nr:hypothetical protein [Mycoplasma todarodis]TCG11966.1 hypothetical protein C4B25_00480 [Mycoplasma todarodis]
MKRNKFTTKKSKKVFTFLSLMGMSVVPIIAATSLAAPVAEQNAHQKILFDGHLFDDYEQALNYFISQKTGIINKELKYGDVSRAMVNLNTGELNGEQLGTVGKDNASVVYKTAFGRGERVYGKALRSYVNPIFTQARFTYPGTDKTFVKREDAQAELDSNVYSDHVFYYKIVNNLFEKKLNQKNITAVNALFNKGEILLNPFNKSQINELKKYLTQSEIINKMGEVFANKWTTNKKTDENNGFNIGIYARKNKEANFEEFTYTENNDISKEIYNKIEKDYNTNMGSAKNTEFSVNHDFITNSDDGFWTSWDVDHTNFDFSFTDVKKSNRSIDDHGETSEEKKVSFNKEDANHSFDGSGLHLKMKYKQDGDDENTTLDISGVKREESKYNSKNDKQLLRMPFMPQGFEEKIEASHKSRFNWKSEISNLSVESVSGKWDHENFHGHGAGIMTHHKRHTFQMKKVNLSYDITKVYKDKNIDISKKTNSLNYLTQSYGQTNIKQVIKYNGIPLFEINKNENGEYTLKNISNEKEYHSGKIIKASNESVWTKYSQKTTIENAFSEFNKIKVNNKINSNDVSLLNMGDGQNKKNDNQEKVSIGLYWGGKFFYSKKQYFSYIISDEVNVIDAKLSGSIIQEGDIAFTEGQLDNQEKKNKPIVTSVFVMFSIDGKPLIDDESIIDNSRYDSIQLMNRNMEYNKDRTTIDREHIFVQKPGGKWKIVSNEIHSIYSVKLKTKKYFATYQNVRDYLLDFIKINSNKVNV